MDYRVWRLINNSDFAVQFNNSGISKLAHKVNPDTFCSQKMIHFTLIHFPGTTNGTQRYCGVDSQDYIKGCKTRWKDEPVQK